MDLQKLRKKEIELINDKLSNPNINDCTKALLGIVKDRQDGTIFYDYEDRETVGLYIYAELINRYDDDLGFILSDDVHESGLLTQAQGVCSLDSLISDYKILPFLYEEEAIKLKNTYQKSVVSILDRIENSDGTYSFDATPYNVDIFDEEYAYLDSMTWSVSALLGALSYCDSDNDKNNNDSDDILLSKDIEQRILKALSYCIKYLNECFVDNSDASGKKLSKGWNFTKDCTEPSLYFTFSVSECYLDIYNTFKEIIDKKEIGHKIDEIKQDSRYEIKNDADCFLYLSAEDSESYNRINVTSESYIRDKRLFDAINGEDERFFELQDKVKSSAKDAWSLVKDGIDDQFYNHNLSGTVSNSTIESSSSSDALFNTAYVINLVISGGLDEEISDNLARAIDDDEMNKWQSEYDDMLDTLQAALIRTIRYNKSLQLMQKEYVVNDFIISCNESFEGDLLKKSQELRKKHIKTLTISPLLVKTNNLISEFLTKYPQYDMIKYLDELLMKKRSMDEAENYLWIWENGDYQITANYYYLISLASFYKYVDSYEKRFSAIDKSNESFKADLLDAQLKELRDNGEIFKLNDENRRLLDDNQRLKEQITELMSKESEIEKAVRTLLYKEVNDNMVSWMTDCFSALSENTFAHLFDGDFESSHTDELKLYEGFRKMFIMSFVKQIKKRLIYVDGVNSNPKAVADLLENGIEELVDDRIKSIIESPEYNK